MQRLATGRRLGSELICSTSLSTLQLAAPTVHALNASDGQHTQSYMQDALAPANNSNSTCSWATAPEASPVACSACIGRTVHQLAITCTASMGVPCVCLCEELSAARMHSALARLVAAVRSRSAEVLRAAWAELHPDSSIRFFRYDRKFCALAALASLMLITSLSRLYHTNQRKVDCTRFR
jgi:hypothetical protein